LKRIIVFIVLSALVLLFLYFPASSASSNGFSAASDGQYRLGWLPSPPGDYAKIDILGYKATLSSAVDLSSQLPPVGDQGNQGSCVGWATSYYYKSWQEGREHPSWSLSNTDYQFSPSFVYNQINGGYDAGSCFDDAFNLLETEGDVDIAEMPYNDNNFTAQPTSTQLEAAKPYRIPEDWGYFWMNTNVEPYVTPNPIDEAKTYLNGGNMLVMGIPVYYDFPDIDGNPANPYYDYDGSSLCAGGHAVAIVGYDDNINPGGSDADHRGGFKMVNSWGPGWNGESEGFVYLSYDFVKRYVSEAWSMNGLSPDSPAISSLSTSSGLVGDTIHIYGNNFGTYRRSARVSFNGVNAVNPTFTNGIITAEVPDGTTTGSLVVYDWDGAASNAEQFSIPQAPPPVPSSYTYYFAEGNIGTDFQEYLCISNPAETTANATITYLFTDGSTAGGPIAISPRSRITVNVSSISGPSDGVSAIITSDQSIVCERPMYFSYNGLTGGHDVMGATAASQTWYFAEGYTGPGFEEYVCVLNPGSTAADLTFRFQTQEAGEIVKRGYNVGAHTRATFKVNDILGPGYQASLKLESSQPVVAERPMYFNYQGQWTGGHCVMGAPELSREYYFAEGNTRTGTHEWLTLQNPNTAPITVDATYQLGAGQGANVTRSYSVGAGRRTTVFVETEVGAGKDVSVKLASASDFLAERPMYFNYQGTWTGGHCVIGAASAGAEWFFAEGYTGDGFHEWLCLQNPGASEATVEITYLTQEAGVLPARTVKVPAGSRQTVLVNSDAGEGYQLSTRLKVTAGPDVVVERPMYFNYGGWTGGHDVVGYRVGSK
jgi:C1A family cysteine protease